VFVLLSKQWENEFFTAKLDSLSDPTWMLLRHDSFLAKAVLGLLRQSS
jgi:hypothetical protein